MLKRLSTSLTKPPQLIIFIKDTWKKLILYLFLLPLILVLPSIAKTIIQPGMSVSQYNALTDIVKSDFDLTGSTITNGIFSTTLSETASFDYFQLTTTTSSLSPYSMTFYLDDDALVLYVGEMAYRSMSYEQLGLENYTFTVDDNAALSVFTTAIKTLYNSQSLTTFIQLFAEYFVAFADYLMIIVLLAMVSYFMIPNQPFSYKLRFKLSIYLTTIYMFSQLVLTLFDAQELNIISIMIAYFYHVWFYRSIKIIPKGVKFNGNTK